MNTPIKKVVAGAVVMGAFIIYLLFTNQNSTTIGFTDQGAAVAPATTSVGTTGNANTGISGNVGVGGRNSDEEGGGEGNDDGFIGNTGGTGAGTGTTNTGGNTGATGTGTAGTGTTGTTKTGTTGGTKTTGQYKDGTYTGPSVDAFYGNIQVAAVIQGGKLVDVQFLQFPSDQGTSREINAQADPMLRQEAIAAQNANVDIVSGATQSSEAFKQSLGSALSQAKI